MTVNTLPSSSEIIGAGQINAEQKIDFAATWDLLIQVLGKKSGQGPQTVASAATLDLDAVTDTRDIVISGTTAITAVTVEAGKVFRCRASGAFTLTNNSSIVTQRAANIVCAAGDSFFLRATAANTVEVIYFTRAAAPPFSMYYESAATTFANGSPVAAFSHGFPGEPKGYAIVLENVNAAGGFTTGQRMPFNVSASWDGAASRGFSVKITSTTIVVCASTNVMQGSSIADGTSFSVTAADWKVVVKAWY
jgi:hypothetical protein